MQTRIDKLQKRLELLNYYTGTREQKNKAEEIAGLNKDFSDISTEMNQLSWEEKKSFIDHFKEQVQAFAHFTPQIKKMCDDCILENEKQERTMNTSRIFKNLKIITRTIDDSPPPLEKYYSPAKSEPSPLSPPSLEEAKEEDQMPTFTKQRF